MADSGSGHQLAVVGDPAPRDEGGRSEQPPAADSATTAPGSQRTGRGRTLLWVAALALLGLLLGYQLRYAGQLEAQVDELTSELGAAREALGVYQRRIQRVRSDLGELATRVGALQELVSEDSFAPGSTRRERVAPASPSSEGPTAPPVRPPVQRSR